MRASLLIATTCFLASAGYAAQDRDRYERRRDERLGSLTERMERRLTYPDPTKGQVWLHEQAAVLLERTRAATVDRYQFDRLASATDRLLEASERILQARDQNEMDEDKRAETAEDLQNDYFRVQLTEYYAKQGQEENAQEYIKLARSLYQQARRAYDERQYERAETLGDAAGYVAMALEALAQAAVRVLDPPPIP